MWTADWGPGCWAGREEGAWVSSSGDAGGTASVWDVATRQPRVCCRGSLHGLLVAISLSPDGMTMVTAGRGHQVRLWDIGTGR